MAKLKKFNPKNLGDILTSQTDEDQHLVESVYWPHVTQTGQRLSFGALPRPSVAMEPLGEMAQKAFGQHRARSNVGHIQWNDNQYDAFPAGVYFLKDVLVHSQAGVICFETSVIAETLWHTATELHNYKRDQGDIIITYDEAKILQGRTLSLLGRADNYFHSVIDGVGRLALLSEIALTGIDHLLVPEGGMGQAELLRIYNVPPNVNIIHVSAEDTFQVEYLVFPFSLHGLFDFHPQINAFFDRILARTPAKVSSPAYIYIDRRGGTLRRLANEDAVVDALEKRGFHIARLEKLSQVEQIQLFRGARMVVGPHGAGLTNIGFSLPGTVLIELMMDAYCNWCFRRLARMRNAKYDCVLGHAIGEWKDEETGAIHGQNWEVSVADVVSTVESMSSVSVPQRRRLNTFGVYDELFSHS